MAAAAAAVVGRRVTAALRAQAVPVAAGAALALVAAAVDAAAARGAGAGGARVRCRRCWCAGAAALVVRQVRRRLADVAAAVAGAVVAPRQLGAPTPCD